MRAIWIVMLGMLSGSAEAVTEDGVWGNDRLLAWSKTGDCFSVFRASNADVGVFVICHGGSGYGDWGDESGQRWTEASAARQRGLIPITTAQRDAFAVTYAVEMRRGCASSPPDQCPRWGFTLVRRSTGATVGPVNRVIAPDWAGPMRDRAAFLGGYLHASGKFALVKFRFVDSRIGDHGAIFEIVKL
jgi:hypothetical protein